MLICPQCKSEYQKGYQICSDCKCGLIEISDPEEKTHNINKTPSIHNITIGITFLISSSLIFFGVSITTVLNASDLTEWYTSKGRFGTALTESIFLLIPFIMSILLFILGVTILLREYTFRRSNE